MEARWYREGNAARTLVGLTRAYVLPLWGGPWLAFVPASLDAEEREEVFRWLLVRSWCVRYGLPEARARLRAFVRRDDEVA